MSPVQAKAAEAARKQVEAFKQADAAKFAGAVKQVEAAKKQAEVAKPACMYGAKCYRKNPDHFEQWVPPKPSRHALGKGRALRPNSLSRFVGQVFASTTEPEPQHVLGWYVRFLLVLAENRRRMSAPKRERLSSDVIVSRV